MVRLEIARGSCKHCRWTTGCCYQGCELREGTLLGFYQLSHHHHNCSIAFLYINLLYKGGVILIVAWFIPE